MCEIWHNQNYKYKTLQVHTSLQHPTRTLQRLSNYKHRRYEPFISVCDYNLVTFCQTVKMRKIFDKLKSHDRITLYEESPHPNRIEYHFILSLSPPLLKFVFTPV